MSEHYKHILHRVKSPDASDRESLFSRQDPFGTCDRQPGKIFSRKMGQLVSWDTTLERDLILQLEYAHDVTAYYERPMPRVNYKVAGERKICCPHFLVVRHDAPSQLVLLQPAGQRSLPEAEPAVHRLIARATAAQYNGTFVILPAVDLRRRPYMVNLRLLWRRAAGVDITPQHRQAAFDFLRTARARTLGALVAHLDAAEPGDGVAVASALIFRRWLDVAVESSLSASTPVRPGLIGLLAGTRRQQ